MAEYSKDKSYDATSPNLEEALYARKAEVESLNDLTTQRGTPIPALYSLFYKFIQNPSAISIDTFKRMIDTDDTVGSGVDFLTTCLAARLGDYTHPSDEIAEWVNKQMNQVEGGRLNKIKEILSATWAGFFCGEKVWANTSDGFVIKRIVPLPPTTILFEVDREGRLTDDGILQYQRNWNPYGLSAGAGMFAGLITAGSGFNIGGARPDPFASFGDLPFPLRSGNVMNYLCIRIPKIKVFHYAFDAQGKFDNPYGRSLLRRIYKYYVAKDTALQQLSVALDRKGTPLLVVYANQHATLIDRQKAGSQQNPKGQDVGTRADIAAATAFKNVHTDSVITLPGKKGQIYEVDSITQDFNAEAFMSALNFHNKSMLRGLLIPALIFGDGDGAGSYALGQEHAKTFDKICDGMLDGLKQTLIQQWVYEMLAYNFPRSAWEKDGLGDFGSRELSPEEREKELAACETIHRMGAIDMNDLGDLNKIREKAGFDPRTEPIPQPEIPGMEDGFGEGEEEEPNSEQQSERAQSLNDAMKKKAANLSLFDESKHPRADDGKFGQGTGSAKGGEKQVNEEDKDAAINSLAGQIKDKDWDSFMDDFESALESAKPQKVTPEMAKKFYRSHTYTTDSDPANEGRKARKGDRGKDVSDPSIAVLFDGKYYVIDGQHRLNTKVQSGEAADVVILDGAFLKKYGVTKDAFSTKTFNSVDKKEDKDNG